MTHADPLAWWGIGLAVAALILHIPLTMLAHHYAPKIEDCLASRSTGRLTARIAKLQAKLMKSEEAQWNFTRGEWEIFDLCRGILMVVLLVLYIGSVVAVGIAAELRGVGDQLGAKTDAAFNNLPLQYRMIVLGAAILLLVSGLVSFSYFLVIDRLRERWLYEHTEMGRERLREQIDKLRAHAKAAGIE